jgi:hypothetical protein
MAQPISIVGIFITSYNLGRSVRARAGIPADLSTRKISMDWWMSVVVVCKRSRDGHSEREFWVLRKPSLHNR